MELGVRGQLLHGRRRQQPSLAAVGIACRTYGAQGRRTLRPCRGVSRHLDEELQHMLWQLDVRQQQSEAPASAGQPPHRRQHTQRVFRGGRRHQQQQQQQHGPGSMSGMSLDLAAAAEYGAGSDGQLAQPISDNAQQVQMQAQAQSQQYHHVRVQPRQSGSQQLRSLADKVCRHIATAGGCLLSASTDVQCCQALTELLLLLEHKQAATASLDDVLLLQPVPCDADGCSGSDECSAAVPPAAAAVPGSSSSSVGEGDSLCLWLTSMPLQTLLRLQLEQRAAAPQHLAAHGAASISSTQELDASMSSLLSLQSVCDDVFVGSSSSSSSTRSSNARDRTAELLWAAQRSNGATAAVLAHAAAVPGGVAMLSAGGHSDPDALSQRVASAAAAGALVAVRVKAHAPGAAAAAHVALRGAASRLAGSGVQLGLLVVPGAEHEHVHLVPQHGSSNSNSSSSSRTPRDDASMDVAAFGALAFAATSQGGGSSSGGNGGGQLLRQRHAKEVWLCAVPLCA